MACITSSEKEVKHKKSAYQQAHFNYLSPLDQREESFGVLIHNRCELVWILVAYFRHHLQHLHHRTRLVALFHQHSFFVFLLRTHGEGSVDVFVRGVVGLDAAPRRVCLQQKEMIWYESSVRKALLGAQRGPREANVESQINERLHFLCRAGEAMHHSPATQTGMVLAHQGQKVSLGIASVQEKRQVVIGGQFELALESDPLSGCGTSLQSVVI
mmetsp:Transcript_30688/g.52596  ORF Transcript_30688/g.52596 Transcript_30688/m.52596 type:complete len:214 (+) Transcript_30688:49-690(+)